MSTQKVNFWVLWCCQAVLTGGVTLSFPFFAVYLHRDRGLPMSVVGACISLSILGTAVSQGLGGELSDIWGRRRVMAMSLSARALIVLGLAAGIWSGWSVPALIGMHILSSFFANFFDPAARGWVADHFAPTRRIQAYGLLRMATNLGWAIGPALGGWLAGKSYALLFGISSAVCFACAIWVMWRVQDSPHFAAEKGSPHTPAVGAESFRLAGVLQAGRDPRLMRLCLYDILIAAVMAQLVVSLSVHAIQFIGLSERQVGLLFSINGLLVVALQYPLGWWWSRRRLTASLAVGSLLYAVGYTGIGFAGGIATMGLCVAVVTLGEISVSPGLHTVAANLAAPNLRGRYLGFLGLTHQFGSALGPLIGGLGLSFISPRWIPGHWMMIGVLALAAAAGFYSLNPILTPEEQGLVPEESMLSNKIVLETHLSQPKNGCVG